MDSNLQENHNGIKFNKVNLNVNKVNLNIKTMEYSSYGGEGLDLVVILDRSGSMSSSILGILNLSKIQAAWKCVQEVLAHHLAGWGLSVMLFPDSRGYKSEWVSKAKDDIQMMSCPHACGGTPLLEALLEAWNHAKSSERSRFILLTDGEPDGRSVEKQQILSYAEKNKHIVIDCVGVSGCEYDANFLKELARITGGIFCEIKDTKELWDTMKLLSPELRKLPAPKKQIKEGGVINL